MNWKLYFQLREKKGHLFKKILKILLILHLIYILGFLFQGQSYACVKLNVTCYDPFENKSVEDFFDDPIVEEVDATEEIEEEALEEVEEDSEAEIEGDEELIEPVEKRAVADILAELDEADIDITIPRDLSQYGWLTCTPGCYSPDQTDVRKIWKGRYLYNPFFIIIYVVIAYIAAYVHFRYEIRKIEKAELAPADDKKDEKEEKK